jgi:glycosyltransferase involved in cell wall biosynthesis
MDMELHKLLTIVIPCKNELKTIETTLALLNAQTDIKGVKVIIADSSNDGTTYRLESRINDDFDLIVLEGGLPARARNNGAKRVDTKYTLFMDADIFILDNNLLVDAMKEMMFSKVDLLTTKVRTSNGKYNYVFKAFDIIQRITKPISPFCLGGFMLIKTNKFHELGGFDEDVIVAEDYLLSKKIKPNKFKILNKKIYTPPRRFDNKGILYMAKLMLGSFFNRENKDFFKNNDTYWK